MPSLYDDEEEPAPPPAPNVPPPGGLGPAGGAPVGGGPPMAPVVPPVAAAGGGGGGGQAAPPMLPGLPGLNLPGAPTFTAPKYMAPTKDTIYGDPGYQAREAAGLRAMERSAAAKGMLRGSNTLAGLSEFNQNLAAQEYQNAVNRYNQQYQAEYKGAYDQFAPQLANWQMRAGAQRDLTRDRFNAELNHFLNQNRGGGGGGGPAFDPSMFLDLPMPPMMPGPGGGPNMPGGGMPGGGEGPQVPMFALGDPWTDPETYY